MKNEPKVRAHIKIYKMRDIERLVKMMATE